MWEVIQGIYEHTKKRGAVDLILDEYFGWYAVYLASTTEYIPDIVNPLPPCAQVGCRKGGAWYKDYEMIGGVSATPETGGMCGKVWMSASPAGVACPLR